MQSNTMQANWRAGLAFSLITALMWGALPLGLKALLAYMDPVTISWYRFAFSAIFAMLWYGHRSGRALKNLLSKRLLPLTSLAVLGLMANYQFYAFGLDYITPSAAQIIIQVAPLLLLLGSIFFFKERFSWLQWVGVAMFSGGMLLFFHHRLSALIPTDASYLLGVGLILLAAVTWAFYGLAQKQLIISENANDLLLLIYLAGTLCFLPWSTPSQLGQLDLLGWSLLAFCGVNTIVAYCCFGLAMTHWQSSRVSATITIAPLLTLLFVTLLNFMQIDTLDTEPLDTYNWLGGILVVIGSSVAALTKSPQRA